MLSLPHLHVLILRQKLENINFEETSRLELARKLKSENKFNGKAMYFHVE